MKIVPSKIATELTAQPVNRPKETPLKPLAESDFAAQLEAAAVAKKAPPDASEIIGSRNALRPLTPADMIHGLKGAPPVLKPLDTHNPNHPAPTELLPLGGIGRRLADHPPGSAAAHRPELEPAVVQDVEGDLVSLADFSENVAGWHASVLKNQGRRR